MRTWIVIPAAGVAGFGFGLVLGVEGWPALCGGAAAAAVAHAVRALVGDSRGALVGSMLAGLLAIVVVGENFAGVRGLATPWLAIAATAWTLAELARVDQRSSLVAVVPATVAAIFEPACVGLIAIAGARVVSSMRHRHAIAIPIAGCLVALLAVIAGAARDGAFATLAAHWYGTEPHAVTPTSSITLLADALGPLLAVAALAGLALLANERFARARIAIAACVAGALLVDLRAGTTGPMTVGLAALCAGVAVGRFATTIRLAAGQAIAGATCAMMLLVPPAWVAIQCASR